MLDSDSFDDSYVDTAAYFHRDKLASLAQIGQQPAQLLLDPWRGRRTMRTRLWRFVIGRSSVQVGSSAPFFTYGCTSCTSSGSRPVSNGNLWIICVRGVFRLSPVATSSCGNCPFRLRIDSSSVEAAAGRECNDLKSSSYRRRERPHRQNIGNPAALEAHQAHLPVE